MIGKIKLSIATTGGALLALGTVGTISATAGTITFDYQAQVSGNATVNPVAALYAEIYLGLDSGSIPTSLDFSKVFTGSFTTLDDPAQFTDGDITLDASNLSNLLGIQIPDVSGSALDNILSIDFGGSGTLTSGVGSTNFNFNYVSPLKAIVINDFNPNVVGGCLVGLCTATGTGSLNISAFNFLEVASGEGQFTVKTNPVSQSAPLAPALLAAQVAESKAVPEPSVLLGLFGVGTLFAAHRKLQKTA